MKTIIQLLVIAILLSILNSVSIAQTPNTFNYQGVIRNADGSVLQNSDVTIKFNIIDGVSTTSVFSESHATTSNAQGVISLVVGEGSNNSGSITTINWSTGNYLLEIEISLDGGVTFEPMGEAKLVAVPYALHAQTVANANDADADPLNECSKFLIFSEILTSPGVSVSIVPTIQFEIPLLERVFE